MLDIARRSNRSARNFICFSCSIGRLIQLLRFLNSSITRIDHLTNCPAHVYCHKSGAKASYLYSAWASPLSRLRVEVLLSPLVMVVREERLCENLYSRLLLPKRVLCRTILLFKLPRVLTVACEVGPRVYSRSLLLLLLSSLVVGSLCLSLCAQNGRSETVLLRARVYPACRVGACLAAWELEVGGDEVPEEDEEEGLLFSPKTFTPSRGEAGKIGATAR